MAVIRDDEIVLTDVEQMNLVNQLQFPNKEAIRLRDEWLDSVLGACSVWQEDEATVVSIPDLIIPDMTYVEKERVYSLANMNVCLSEIKVNCIFSTDHEINVYHEVYENTDGKYQCILEQKEGLIDGVDQRFAA